MRPRLITVALLCTHVPRCDVGHRRARPGARHEPRHHRVHDGPGRHPARVRPETGRRQFGRQPLLQVLRTRRPDHERRAVDGRPHQPRCEIPHHDAETARRGCALHLREDPRCQNGSGGSTPPTSTVSGSQTSTHRAGSATRTSSSLVSRTRPPDGDDAFAPVTAEAPNGHAQVATRSGPYGCEASRTPPSSRASSSSCRRASSATRPPSRPCPTFLFIASSCSDRSILGHSVTETVVDGATASRRRPGPTPVYNVADHRPRTGAAGHQRSVRAAGPVPDQDRPAHHRRLRDQLGADRHPEEPRRAAGADHPDRHRAVCRRCRARPRSSGPAHGAAARPRRARSSSTRPRASRRRPRSRRGPGRPTPSPDTKTSDSFTPTGCDAVPFDADCFRDADRDRCSRRAGRLAGSHHGQCSRTRTTRDDPIWQAASRTPTSRCPRAWRSRRRRRRARGLHLRPVRRRPDDRASS